MRKHKKGSIIIALATMIYSALFIGGTLAYATSNETEPVSNQKYHFENVVYAGDDDGFPDKGIIEEGNVHFGWKLGKFVVSGFTRVNDESSDVPVFLKNVGDEIKMSFLLEENIDALKGDSSLSINEDTGYDTYFGIEKTEFGKGALIIRKTDYQNNVSAPQIYTDYLSGVSVGSETKVQLFEEGDYEVALDYSILEKSFDDLWVIPTSKIATFEEDYKIFFKFKVRNGNCMVYPHDVSTKQELTNTAFTPNGFYLDLANSKYLDIDITKQTLNAGKDGLEKDTRFNQPARDREPFTDEGIYNITVKNRYTGRETDKTIYVGDNVVLQAYVSNTGYSISEINNLIETGATINADGSIKMPETTTTTTTTAPATEILKQSETTTILTTSVNADDNDKEKTNEQKSLVIPMVAGVGGMAVLISVITALILSKRRK